MNHHSHNNGILSWFLPLSCCFVVFSVPPLDVGAPRVPPPFSILPGRSHPISGLQWPFQQMMIPKSLSSLAVSSVHQAFIGHLKLAVPSALQHSPGTSLNSFSLSNYCFLFLCFLFQRMAPTSSHLPKARNLSVILGSLLPFPNNQSPNSVDSTTRISEVLLCQFYHLNIRSAFVSAWDCRHLHSLPGIRPTSLTIGVTMSLRQCSYLSKGRGTLATELSPDISTWSEPSQSQLFLGPYILNLFWTGRKGLL